MSTKLLCHFDGTNGQTTTVDSSPVERAVTLTGATLTTTNPKFGTASLDMTGGGSNRALCLDSADWHFGAGQFTIEGWVYFTSAPGSNSWAFVTQWGGSTDLGFYLGMSAGELRFRYSTTGTDFPTIGAAWTPTLNTWYHLAVDRDASNVLRAYIDGVVHASATAAVTLWDASRSLMIGNDENLNRALIGRIDEVMIDKGVALYGGPFTPPIGSGAAQIVMVT